MALLTVLVLGVGAVLVPRDVGKPQEVPFSETARSEALSAAEALLASASLLESTTPDGAASSAASSGNGLTGTLMLLTSHARALLAPSGPTTASATTGTASSALASPTSRATQDRPTRTTFVSALSSSASRRLTDAAKTDGGMARLLAAVGTAQLLESSRLAAAWGLPVTAPTTAPEPTPAPTPPPSCPVTRETTTAPAKAVSPATASPAGLPAALAAVVSSEQEAVYAYQVALTRLDAKAAATAATWLGKHQELLRGAEAQGRLHCVATPPTEAGYRLPPSIATQPGVALGTMESSSLPAYADLVALSDGETRQWAIEGLVDAAKRSQAWGIPVGSFPGLSLDDASLPPFPSTTPAP